MVFSNIRLVHGLSEFLAVHGDYRFYTDDWGIKAHTFEPSLAISFMDDLGIFRILYRYHNQTATKYYQDQFTGAREFMTSDSDLDNFSVQEGGLQCTAEFEGTWFIDSFELGGTVLYYKRSNDLQAQIFQISLSGLF